MEDRRMMTDQELRDRLRERLAEWLFSTPLSGYRDDFGEKAADWLIREVLIPSGCGLVSGNQVTPLLPLGCSVTLGHQIQSEMVQSGFRRIIKLETK